MSGTQIHTIPSMDEAEALRSFWHEHWDEFLERYPEQFVAVGDGEVVAAHSDLAVLVHELHERRLDPAADVAIEFISAWANPLLL